VTEADVVIFAGLSGDYNVLHTDAEHMKASQFGERIAHGLLGLSIQQGLLDRVVTAQVTGPLAAVKWKFKGPIKIGDTIHVGLRSPQATATAGRAWSRWREWSTSGARSSGRRDRPSGGPRRLGAQCLGQPPGRSVSRTCETGVLSAADATETPRSSPPHHPTGKAGAIPAAALCRILGLGCQFFQPPRGARVHGLRWRFLKPSGWATRSGRLGTVRRSMKEGGVVVEERSILNQHGEVVQSGRLTLLVAKRPAA
jgi:acyl dehydratase